MNTRSPINLTYTDIFQSITDFIVMNSQGFSNAQLDKISFIAESELIDRNNQENLTDVFDGESQ